MSNAGIKFYLDDFGTGYSSLERMTELPFSVVKLINHSCTVLFITRRRIDW
ncbi:MAG: EAL domain-containing protein [Lachnospiraceae bacterium]|nr:EAL domain-containing protein [Lachnospiraceae bacterium]